jgi:hypothetical protein
LTISLQTAPGPVGLMLGEKELSPPMAFSVGETAGADDGEDDGGVDGGVVELVAGASFSVVGLQPVMAPTATRAAPAPISKLRVKPAEVMRASSLLVGEAWGEAWVSARPAVPLRLMVTASQLNRQGALKPSRLCAPSQNGFFSEWPQRHR